MKFSGPKKESESSFNMTLSNTTLGGNEIFNSNNIKKTPESEEQVYVKIWGKIFSLDRHIYIET